MIRVIVKCIKRCDHRIGVKNREIEVGEIRELLLKDTDRRYYFSNHAWYPIEYFVEASQLEKLLWIGRKE